MVREPNIIVSSKGNLQALHQAAFKESREMVGTRQAIITSVAILYGPSKARPRLLRGALQEEEDKQGPSPTARKAFGPPTGCPSGRT